MFKLNHDNTEKKEEKKTIYIKKKPAQNRVHSNSHIYPIRSEIYLIAI